MRELLRRLSIDEMVCVLYAVAMRLALRGLLNIVDVAVIRELTGDPPEELDQAA